MKMKPPAVLQQMLEDYIHVLEILEKADKGTVTYKAHDLTAKGLNAAIDAELNAICDSVKFEDYE